MKRRMLYEIRKNDGRIEKPRSTVAFEDVPKFSQSTSNENKPSTRRK
jgi:hypothetical protein